MSMTVINIFSLFTLSRKKVLNAISIELRLTGVNMKVTCCTERFSQSLMAIGQTMFCPPLFDPELIL